MGERAGSNSTRHGTTSSDDREFRRPKPIRRRQAADRVTVCQVIPSLGLGGAEQVAVRIANQSADEFDQSICYLGVEKTLVSDVDDSVDLYTCGVESRYDLTAVRPLRRILKAGAFDVVHAHLPIAQSLARLSSGDATVVSTHHNLPTLYGFPERHAEWATRFRDDAAVAVSETVKRTFEWRFARTTEWRTIYNGIEVEEFHERVRSAHPQASPVDADLTGKTVFLNVARYIPAKKQKRLLEAFAELQSNHPSVYLLVVGGGPLHEDLLALAAELDIAECVTITGEVPRTDIHRYFAAADAFVLSSESEGLGIVLLEAMASQLPVVTTDFDASREIIVSGETGIIVEGRNLTEGMEQVLSNGRQSKFGRRGYERVRDRFDATTMVSEYEDLYRDVA